MNAMIARAWAVRRFSSRPAWLLLFGFLALALVEFTLFPVTGNDDPYITFRYADNLHRGLGFVYNPDVKVLSTTTPLYTLLLAGLAWLWPELPRLSNLLSAFSLALAGWAVALAGRAWGTTVAGVVAGVLLALAPLAVASFGAETCFYLALIAAAFAVDATGRPAVAAALVAGATLARPDAGLAAVILLVTQGLRVRRIPWTSLLIYAALILPWVVFAWAYFGSPLPATLAAKQAQGRMAVSQSFLAGLQTVLRVYAAHPGYWVQAGLAGLGLVVAGRRARRWLIWFAWGALYAGAYAALGVTRYFWYYTPLVPVVTAAVGLGVAEVRSRLAAWSRRPALGNLAAGLLLASVLWPQVTGLIEMRSRPDPRLAIYAEAGRWFAAQTAPDASIGSLEVGVLGYTAQRRMIDFAGLIQPEAAGQMHRTTTYADIGRWALTRYRPDYLALDPRWFPDWEGEGVLAPCSAVITFAVANAPNRLVIYACRWSQ